MRRVAAIVLLAASLVACTSRGEADRLRFGAPRLLAAPVGPVTFTVAPDDVIYYAELRTNDVYSVRRGQLPDRLFHSQFKPDSLAVDYLGRVFVAARSQKHQLLISRYDGGVERRLWRGGASRYAAHLGLDNAVIVVGWHSRLFALESNGPIDQTLHVMSRGYTDPVFTFGKQNHIWVADNALPGKTERVAGTELPAYTNPSGIVVRGDDILLCSRTHKKVYRLHIDADEHPRWRNQVPGMQCDRDIAVLSDGSVITAQSSVIYRYPPR